MKTKNFLLTGALLIVALFSVNGVMAQGPAANQTIVKIQFTPIQTIQVNGSQKVVNFVYDKIETYQNGAAVQEKEKHLEINSSGPFEVNVVSSGFTGGLAGMTIPASDVAVQVVKSSNNSLEYSGTGIAGPQELSTTSTPLFASNFGGIGLDFDVTYSNPGGAEGNYFKGYLQGAVVDYTATVTYTILAK